MDGCVAQADRILGTMYYRPSDGRGVLGTILVQSVNHTRCEEFSEALKTDHGLSNASICHFNGGKFSLSVFQRISTCISK